MGPVSVQRKSSARMYGVVAFTSNPVGLMSGSWTHLAGSSTSQSALATTESARTKTAANTNVFLTMLPSPLLSRRRERVSCRAGAQSRTGRAMRQRRSAIDRQPVSVPLQAMECGL